MSDAERGYAAKQLVESELVTQFFEDYYQRTVTKLLNAAPPDHEGRLIAVTEIKIMDALRSTLERIAGAGTAAVVEIERRKKSL